METASKKASQQLKKGTEWLNAFFMQSPAAIAVLEGKDHVFVLANSYYQKLFSRTEDQVLGRTIREVFPELAGQGIYELFDTVFTTGKPYLAHEYAGTVMHNGVPRQGYYDFTIHPIKNTTGEVTDVMVHVFEVTSRVLINKKIQESEERVRKLFMEAPAAIVVFEGPQLVITLANPIFEKVFGRTHEQMIGNPVEQVFPELVEQGIINILDNVFKTGVPFFVNALPVAFNKYGESVPGYYDGIVQPIRNSEGKIIELLALAVDVTDQINAGKKIEESERQLEQKVKERTAELERKNTELENAQSFLQQLLDSSVEFIIVLDTNLRYITINRKYEQFLGIAREDIQGKYLFDVNPKSEGTIQHASILKALQGEPVHLDNRPSISRPEFYVDTHFIPLIQQGEIRGVIIQSRDVTKVVQSEKLLAQKNKELEVALSNITAQKAKDAQKDEFISIASHELKTPLTTIKGYVQLIEDMLHDQTDDTMLRYIKKASSAIDRLNNLTTDLLDATKMQHGKLNLNFTNFDFNEMLEDVIEFTRHTSPGFIVVKTGATTSHVHGDKERLHQVCANLLSNAVKYSNKHGKIEVFVNEEPHQVTVDIIDTGIGIDADNLHKVFDRFYRVNNMQGQGLGIGLYITKEIVERHHGKIWAKSQPGIGSTFTFTLPRRLS